MIKERKHLTLSEIHGLDVKKLMIDIDYLDVLIDSCDKRSVLEMWKTKNGLDHISDRELITLAQFATLNTRLEDMGKKFSNKCNCKK